MKKFNFDTRKILSGCGLISMKIREVTGKVISVLKSVSSRVDWKIFALPAIILVVLVALAEIVFGTMIYGFKVDNKATQTAAKIIPFPIAVANFDFVSYRDYLKEKDYIHHFYQATKQEEVNFNEIDSQIIDQLIENKLVKNEAIKHNVKVDQADLNSTIDLIVEQNGGKDKVEGVLQELYGLTLKDFAKLVEIQLLRDKLNDTMIVKIDARHILIRVDQDSPQDKVDSAKAKIDGILKEIQDGLDFSEAAKKYSEDIGSAEQGGKLEPFSKGEMVDAFSDAAFATKKGEISSPIRSEFGWHIIKIENRTGSIEKKFSEWMEQIRSKSLIMNFYEI